MNIYVQVFVWIHVFIYLGSETAGSYVTLFNFLKKCQIVFQSNCIILHTYQQHMWVSISLHFVNTCYYVFFTVAILVGVKWYFTVCLIYTSLMADDVECLFMCLLASFRSSLEKYLFRYFAHLLLLLLVFFWSCPWYVEVPRQGWIPCQNSDSTRSSTCCATRELLLCSF